MNKVAVTRSRLYLNFGPDWRSDFTAGAAMRSKAFPQAVIAKLQALEGQRVRLRGWIERRNGPYVELFHPSQIEPLPGAQDMPPADGLARGPVPPGVPSNRSPAEAPRRPAEPEAPRDAIDL